MNLTCAPLLAPLSLTHALRATMLPTLVALVRVATVLVVVGGGLAFAPRASAQSEATASAVSSEAVPSDEAVPAPREASLDLSVPALAPDGYAEALAYADGESRAAAWLYGSSIGMLLLGGGVGVLGALIAGLAAPAIGLPMMGVGALGVLGHVVTFALAVSYDVGSSVRHERLASGRVALRVTGGAGDVGLGLALEF